jgi:predicted metalloprotease
MIDEYRAVCVDSQLTGESAATCDAYLDEIRRMQDVGREGATVREVGNFGHLESTPEYATRTVSNDDHRPAVTHEAVCYLAFIGECAQAPLADPVAQTSSPSPSPSSDSSADDGDDSDVAVGSIGAEPANPASDAEIEAEIDDAVALVSAFWRTHFDDLFPSDPLYLPPEVGGMYTSSDIPPTCGGQALSSDNAFYCPADNTVWFGADLVRKFSSASSVNVELIVGHEWGHAIQHQIADKTSRDELRSDCLSAIALYGAVEDGDFAWQDQYTEDLTFALTEIADATQWATPDDHGDAFERINAFKVGRDEGLDGCLSEF